VALSPGAIGNLGPIHNPLGIESLPRGYKPVQTIMSALLLVAAGSTLGFRLLRTRGIERQQLKWPALIAVMAAGGSLLYDTAISEAIGLRWLEWAGYVILMAALVGFPISIGIAIVRYRLYEIDTLINRTLVYGSLTAILAAIYFGAAVLLQRLFVALTGEKSTLAVVVSTLVIAALFTPLRRRIQGFIDRRFYRSKYDAAKTLEAFSAKLRDETDLDALSDDLVGVVKERRCNRHTSLCGCVVMLARGGVVEVTNRSASAHTGVHTSQERRTCWDHPRSPSETGLNAPRRHSLGLGPRGFGHPGLLPRAGRRARRAVGEGLHTN
jgi:hypothetical protein